MNIICCIKQVPSTETKIRLNPQTGLVDTTEVEWVINPYDEYALELGLRIRETLGNGRITAISLGPERVKMALRTALAMGVDEAVHIWDEDFEGIDGLAIGRVLAAAIRKMEFDLVLTGKQAIDDDLAWVPQAIAHFLGIPHCAVVPEVELDRREQGEIVAHREVEGATEMVHLRLPGLLTVQKGKFQPRYPTLKLMMAAKKKEIPVWDKNVLGIEPGQLTRQVQCLGHRMPPERKPGRILEGELTQVVPELVRLLHTEAKVV
ncbi:MAG: electron transfer flavoprotein subunit beta/FixA family protein [candidate division WOR-3 bacterium]|jgi:electron transfer flavoprotein beta subunit